ncbi:MAG: pyruvate kinase [Chitinophagaceae bacterium]|nr:MAG: pyruvate kinase [Chitinophagaceae bacterium]
MIKTYNKTKIIATVGPACSDYEVLLELIKEGVNVFRLNFSHGKHEEHLETINNVRKINRAYKLNVGILADLQGPKIRIGEVENDAVYLEENKIIEVVSKKQISTEDRIYVSYENLAKDVKPGERLLIDDGKIIIEVTETNRVDLVLAKVIYGGVITANKGVNMPETTISVPSLTPKDLVDLDFALKHKANWIALSFVRKASDVQEVKQKADNPNAVKVIAKIEKPEAIKNIDEIIDAADGIMVARGDLGVEVPIDRMPMIQKDIVKKCIQKNKPVIIATQIMDSMINNPMPTRAEVSDVANAIIDGADALMLSGETSVGKYPVKVIRTMVSIMKQVELEPAIYNKQLTADENSPTFLSDAVCFNACMISESLGGKAIIGHTRSGYTAFMLSSYRPKAKIFIFTDNEALLNILSLCWGVQAFYYDKFVSTDGTISDVIQILKNASLVKKDDVIINTGSMPLEAQGRTNMLKVTKVD